MMLLTLVGCLFDRATYEARLAELTDNDGDGTSEFEGDCDDEDAAVHAEAAERCNERDDDCDGGVDESDGLVDADWFADADGDGFGGGSAIVTCAPAFGLVEKGEDCDDTDADLYPGATERCNDVDDDCNGIVDDPEVVEPRDWYTDADADGYGSGDALSSCPNPGGASLEDGDCDDLDADVNPGAVETCNGVDDDCNGAPDDAPAVTWYLDRDEDGFGDDATTYLVCTPPPGYSRTGGDCDDMDEATNPGAWDECEDGEDSDCSGQDVVCGIPIGSADIDDVSARFTGPSGEDYVARTVASAGDLDGDGDDELLVARGAWGDYLGKVEIVPGDPELYLGEIELDSVTTSLVGLEAGGMFGFSLGTGADVDGDGVNDLGVATWGPDLVALFQGNSSLLATDHDRADAWAIYRSEAGTGTFGVSVALLGDLDGDGLGEVLIGDNRLDDEGAAWLFYGDGVGGEYSTTADGVKFSGGEVDEQAGQDGCTPGDFDGDGLSEMVIANNLGAGGDAVRGGGFLFFGSRTRFESSLLAEADVVYEGGPTQGLFESCAGVGDIDDDGRSDLAFAGPRFDDGRGSVFVILSDPSPVGGPLYDVAEVEWLGEVSSPIGASVSGPGDLDGDGHDDLVATSSREDGTPVAAMLPGAAGLTGDYDLADAVLVLAGGNTESEGDALTSRLDLNGDGAADLAMSAWTGSQSEAWLLYGSP